MPDSHISPMSPALSQTCLISSFAKFGASTGFHQKPSPMTARFGNPKPSTTNRFPTMTPVLPSFLTPNAHLDYDLVDVFRFLVLRNCITIILSVGGTLPRPHSVSPSRSCGCVVAFLLRPCPRGLRISRRHVCTRRRFRRPTECV